MIASNILIDHLFREKILLGQEENRDLIEYLGSPMTTEGAAKMVLSIAEQLFKKIIDLKILIVQNRTKIPFVTSDNPVVISNKLILQKYTGRKNWGLESAGVYLFMPLSPVYGFLAFDSNVYEIRRRVNDICVANEADVARLNQLIYLNSENCIFTHDETVFKDLIPSMTSVSNLKTDGPFRINITAIGESNKSKEYEKFVVVDDESFKKASKGLIHLESTPPKVHAHFPNLLYKYNPRYMDTKSGAGWVRYYK